MSDSKDKEPDVLFVGDSIIQLMHQFGVKHRSHTFVCLVLCPIASFVLVDTNSFSNSVNFRFNMADACGFFADMAATVLSAPCPKFWGGW